MTVTSKNGEDKTRVYTIEHDNGTDKNELQISVGQYPQKKAMRSAEYFVKVSTNDRRLHDDIRNNAFGFDVACDPVVASVIAPIFDKDASTQEEPSPPYVIEFKIHPSYLARNNLDRFFGTVLDKLRKGFVIGAEDAAAIHASEKEFRPPGPKESMFASRAANPDNEPTIIRLSEDTKKGPSRRG